ncbi:MAG: hypothetical protein J6S87_01555 [Bacteroidales bacterium]|nr:hypothetical protein [Bacteroidales bacterium]
MEERSIDEASAKQERRKGGTGCGMELSALLRGTGAMEYDLATTVTYGRKDKLP